MSFARRLVVLTILGAALAMGIAFAAIVALIGAAPAAASTSQRAILQDDLYLLEKPKQTLTTLQMLGVTTIRVTLRWSSIAPNPNANAKPGGFDATNPGSYPQSNWAPHDTLIRDAQQSGIEVLLTVTGAAPRWALGRGNPNPRKDYGQWKPSAREYGQFVQAAATRYNGHYTPPGSSSALPGVRFWELWNEENWGQDLAPQANGQSAVSVSPGLYRPLLDAGWSALGRTGHGRDTILIGSLSPRGFTRPGAYLTTKPLKFIRALYCVGDNYRPLRGGAAARIGCPANGRGLRSAHPALFSAGGVGMHPYPFHLPPTQADSNDPDFVEFNELPRLESTVSRLQHVYGSGRLLPVYNTEYGYETNPPNRSDHFVSPQTAGYYINWAEYLSYKRPWIMSYMQFLLHDPPPGQGASFFGKGGFAAGLIFANGTQKADYGAFRMPIYMPRTSTKPGHRLEVWGCVRPAHFALLNSGKTQLVQIQLNRRTVATIPIRNVRGYFDVFEKFPSSGVVSLRWAYPDGVVIHSRTVSIRIH